MKKLLAFASIAFLVGCSSVKSSGVQPVGKNIYTVTASTSCAIELNGAENSSKAREKALSDANNYCLSKDSQINVLEERINRGECASVIINFNCQK